MMGLEDGANVIVQARPIASIPVLGYPTHNITHHLHRLPCFATRGGYLVARSENSVPYELTAKPLDELDEAQAALYIRTVTQGLDAQVQSLKNPGFRLMAENDGGVLRVGYIRLHSLNRLWTSCIVEV